MIRDDRVEEACRTYLAQRRMGGSCEERDLFTLVHAPERPDVWDANFGCDVRAAAPEEIEAVLEALDARMRGRVRVRKFFCDPRTPPPFVAALCLRGFEREATVQLVLEGELCGTPPKAPVEIRPAEREEDWASLHALTALDVAESMEKAGRGAPEASFLHRFVGMRRAMSPPMRMWLARVEGRDQGFVGSWPGVVGMGMVEWLFCRPEARRRGVATALLARGVADARERGAGPVLIGASAGPDAVPRRLYAALGFRPVCLTEEYVRFVRGRETARRRTGA